MQRSPRYRVRTALNVSREQAQALDELAESTGLARSVLLRTGLDLLLKHRDVLCASPVIPLARGLR
jgi:predicted DNA-binding protein